MDIKTHKDAFTKKKKKKKKKQDSVQVKRVKVSHSLIAVGAVGVRIPLYLGHS